MPIVASDIKFRLSGGASNTDPNAALGGAMSTAGGGIITTDVLNNLWDNVSGTEAGAGDTEYRGIYIRNEHGSLTYTNPILWISSNTTSGDDTIEIALADEAVDAEMETIGDESTAPTGPTFSAPATKGAPGLSLGSLGVNSFKGVWIKRIVNSSASAANANPYTLSVEGETAA